MGLHAGPVDRAVDRCGLPARLGRSQVVRRRSVVLADLDGVVVQGDPDNPDGRLMLIDASLDNQRVYVIIDTGSEISVGNMALRTALARNHRLGTMLPITMVSVTGGRITAEYTIARRMRIGDADINNLPIAFADVHPFRQLQLLDRPAILLGMDALQLFRRVSVDFANRRVRLLTPRRYMHGSSSSRYCLCRDIRAMMG